MIGRARLWIRSLLLRRRLEREMQEEMAEHLERSTARLMARGLSAEEARREALREFGNVAYLQEEGRIARGTSWLDALVGDARFAMRHFGRRPATTTTLVLLLAFGIGVNSIAFTFLRSYALQPPPGISSVESMVRIRGSQRSPAGLVDRSFSRGELEAYRGLTSHFSDVSGWTSQPVTARIDAEGGSLTAIATFVTPGYFDVLGVRPLVGRGLPDPGAAPAAGEAEGAVIDHVLWQSHFAADPEILGRTVSLNGIPIPIVGVAPPRFMGAEWFAQPQLWLPLASRRLFAGPAPAEAEIFRAAGRLRLGVAPADASAPVEAIATRIGGGIEREIGRSPSVDWRATLVTLGAAVALGTLFGLSPALHATRLAIATALKDSTATLSATRARLQRGLVVAQIAFTQPLAVCLAASVVLATAEYRRHSPNPLSDHVVEMRAGVDDLESLALAPPVEPETEDARARREADAERLVERLSAAPGIARVVRYGSGRPFSRVAYAPDDGGRPPGSEAESIPLTGLFASPGYFEVLGIPIELGRGFSREESSRVDAGSAAAIPIVIGADLARRLWPGSSPLGQRLSSRGESTRAPATLEVVGVVDAGLAYPGSEHRVYLPPDPARLDRNVGISLLIRTTSPAEPLLPELRRLANEAVPASPVTHLRTLAAIEAEEQRTLVLATGGLTGAGLVALLIAALGLYAVVSFSVGHRTGEIAVRMAVGARPGHIRRRFAGDGLRLSAIGVVLGLPASIVGLRLLLAELPGLPGGPELSMPLVASMAAGGIFAVALAATWLPASRAARVDPAVTLRRG